MSGTLGWISRRQFHEHAAALLAAGAACASAEQPSPGAIRGEPTAEKVGQEVLAAGGNAIDAAVAAALVAAVAAPHQTGIGGYGGHMTLFAAKANKLTCIDFNSHAPATARPDMFPLDATGKVVGQKNMYGWLAAGVPGILAGLHLALTKYGMKSFREIVQPAIGLAREGFPIGAAAAAIKSSANQLAADPGSRALYFQDGQPLAASDRFRNPELAKLLESLAADNSVEPFYRGEIAQRIATNFAKNGGLVTAEDFAAYRAHEVEPLKITWGEWTIRTAPLTAGGATALHALLLLQELHWAARDAAAAETLQLQVEALRYAWQDRLELFGDPQGGASPLERVLQPAAIRTAAERIAKAVAARQPLPVRTTSQPDQGTIHLSAADREGNLAAVTLTHGGSFGARVTVPGLGLTLGHGMSRFDPHAGHPNAPGPHKRPLNNMCPTIVARGGRPLIALGARGGRKIPNAVAEVLLQLVAREKPLADAVAAPRLHTEGQLALNFEKSWPSAVLEELKARGYQVTVAASATVSAAEAGSLASAMR